MARRPATSWGHKLEALSLEDLANRRLRACHRPCEERVLYRYRYTCYKGRARTTTGERELYRCRTHARRIAERHGIELPEIDPELERLSAELAPVIEADRARFRAGGRRLLRFAHPSPATDPYVAWSRANTWHAGDSLVPVASMVATLDAWDAGIGTTNGVINAGTVVVELSDQPPGFLRFTAYEGVRQPYRSSSTARPDFPDTPIGGRR